jgi:phage terminase Nu1 subunit (DNA packaging protein)
MRGEKRGSYAVASITRYCEHLRVMAAGRGGEDASAARARLGAAQADLASTKTAKMRGELVETDAVEKLWITKMKAFRARILGHPAKGPISERAADRGFDARASGGADRVAE